ncbi:hypothetical protein [Xenorhabdus eapokensis]|uniref:Non-ribosomal peptide synthetase n=1 Tax=Xenorhabdus eapokensis TaxID=1873482 RepID=A0A1Q5TLJ1_9GAMM|nr:hypothetical protein [Xenorhabdus eapokensis]OKP01067.1 non-ribosomal peptide synthetase [Xenorhabdus eapokensis]
MVSIYPQSSHTPNHDKWLYRTGEQVRWLPNGELKYLGTENYDFLKEAS